MFFCKSARCSWLIEHVLCIINKGNTSLFWGTSQLTHVSEFYITPFFETIRYNIVLVNWPRAHCGVLQLTEASYLRPDSPRTSPRNETVKQCRRQMTVANSPLQWPSWTWCRKWWNHSWHSSRVTLNQRCFAFIRPRTPLVYRYHVILRTQSHSAVFGCSPSGWMPGVPIARHHVVDSWATSVLVGLNMHRAGGTDWGKNKV